MAGSGDGEQVPLNELRFPRDLDSIASLPPVEESALVKAEAKELAKVMGAFRGLLIRITQPDDWKDGDGEDGQRRYVHGSVDLFWVLLEKLASYYTFAIYRFAESTSPAVAGKFILQNPFPFEADDESVTAETHLELVRAFIILIENDSCSMRQFTSAIYDFSGFQPGELPAEHDPDLTVIQRFEEFHSITEKAHKHQRQQIAMRLLGFAFKYRSEVLRQRNATRQKEIRESLEGLSPRELRALAKRNEMMVKKYGAKKVERVFEQRLALLFQSLGFTVVQARPGDEAADLLCISRTEHFSFLVDAKSSKGNYTLPKADQRALRDYAANFRRKLPDLPPLAMVVVVGGDAAGTLEPKIEKLQDEIELPVRFVPIKVLSEFRRVAPGPIPASLFRDSIKKAPVVVDGSLSKGARDAVATITAAYERFIGDLEGAGAL